MRSLLVRFFPFSTLKISCHSLLACRVSAERSAVKHMQFPLYVTCCFSLAAFNNFSLCLVFVSLVCILVSFSSDLPCIGHFRPLGLDYLLFHVGKIFNYNLFQKISCPFFFSPSSRTPIIQMLVCLTLSHRSLRLSSVLFILFTLFCSSEFISTILSLIHSSASDMLLLIPSRVFINSAFVLFVSVCIFF